MTIDRVRIFYNKIEALEYWAVKDENLKLATAEVEFTSRSPLRGRGDAQITLVAYFTH